MKSAIVTGATGVLGSALVRMLAERGITVYVVCHPGSTRNETIPQDTHITLIPCDLRDILSLPDKIGHSCDVFFHLAWLGTADPRNRMDMYLQNDNVRYALDSVEVAHRLRCEVYLGAGSQAEYGRVEGVLSPDTPTNPVGGYGMAKLCAGAMTRAMCHKYGIRHVWPRILSVYGPYMGKNTLISYVIRALLAGEKPSLTACEQIWDYLYAADAAEALIAMAEKGQDGSVYTLGSGISKPLHSFVEAIRDAIGPTLEIGFGEKPYYADQSMHLQADISRLTEDTGWKPCVEFKEGIRALIDFERKLANESEK